MRVWATSGAVLRERSDTGVGEIHALAPAPDGSWLAYGCRDGAVRVRGVGGPKDGRRPRDGSREADGRDAATSC